MLAGKPATTNSSLYTTVRSLRARLGGPAPDSGGLAVARARAIGTEITSEMPATMMIVVVLNDVRQTQAVFLLGIESDHSDESRQGEGRVCEKTRHDGPRCDEAWSDRQEKAAQPEHAQRRIPRRTRRPPARQSAQSDSC